MAIRTHIITEKDDLPEVVRRYTRGIAQPGDVIALSESMVAITQGRAVLPQSVKVGRFADFLRRFAHPDGSLATPAAMQLAIQEAGLPRVLAAAAAAAIGRLFGRRGVFFRVADRGLNLIDDIGGTLYPYDRTIVLGPVNGQEVARRVKEATGVDTLIADVNDIHCVDIIGFTGQEDPRELLEALRNNPQGNDDEQTPIVVLKRVAS
ncbi:MAG: coenzyme F420-0:L-glutamate ligase [Limnochordaceae bacterium]|uniref:Coenzyme F420-0:L-glutamate ligase n=1 Tax=Carboxydichorda subterranea TaxID=3109565 RepID=A0ABZ1BVW9_9FIRM|nr:coenzyme F420-0:L-glutamate ligase [Limnochorda sp. L945t]MBE3599279.1 coenzyme F420-0:L-glutamate ligase [Limnochordaceae bacterium]WRP16743.1 coenzyme F420-0:L-glutamate ligase [Limnochorda sp. L945t]